MFAFSSAGALFSEDVKERLRAKLKTTLIIDAFGMSEAGHQGMNLGKNADGKLRFSIDALTAVLDDDLRPVEPGSGKVGMLARTGRLPLGYWKDPEKTAKTFVTDPEGRRWVMAGDMATIDQDGTAVVLGRGSLCINSGGEKIYPEEVELALRSHPGVYDAVVVGVPDERWGQRVAAVVQAQPGAVADAGRVGGALLDAYRALQAAARAASCGVDAAVAGREGGLRVGEGRRFGRRDVGSGNGPNPRPLPRGGRGAWKRDVEACDEQSR